MNTPKPPKFNLERYSWLVRFHRSGHSTDWLIEVQLVGAPEGSNQSYHFANHQSWLDWCTNFFEQAQLQSRNE